VIDEPSAERLPISTTEGDDIIVRGHRLEELIGGISFTSMFLLDLDGEMPPPGRVAVADAVLTALMEHGLTPSTVAARLVLDGAPESFQGAIAAGLLSTGSRFLGTVEQVAETVQRLAAEPDLQVAARAEVARAIAAKQRVPGVGHNLHADIDPRVEKLLRVAQSAGSAGRHIDALLEVHKAAEEARGRSFVINAAGAVGAILSDLGYPPPVVRGFAVLARCAGLVAHLADEQRRPIARAIWQPLNHDGGVSLTGDALS
jgi:citrate synthase